MFKNQQRIFFLKLFFSALILHVIGNRIVLEITYSLAHYINEVFFRENEYELVVLTHVLVYAILLLLYAFFTTYIVVSVTKHKIRYYTWLLLFFVTYCIFLAFYAQTQSFKHEFLPFIVESEISDRNAKNTVIEVLDFNESGEVDTQGRLKKLNLSVRFTSSRDFTMNSPFVVSILEPVTYNEEKLECSVIIYSEDVIKTYKVKKGINEVNYSLTSFTPKYTVAGYTLFERKINVGLSFRIHLRNTGPKILFGQSDASIIKNVTNVSARSPEKLCIYPSTAMTFNTKQYVIRY